jgi:hypothetical protein
MRKAKPTHVWDVALDEPLKRGYPVLVIAFVDNAHTDV